MQKKIFGKLKQFIPNNTELKMLKEMLENRSETTLKLENEMYKKIQEFITN